MIRTFLEFVLGNFMLTFFAVGLLFSAVAIARAPKRVSSAVEVALLQARPHLGESLRAYANVAARVGIQMRYPQTDTLTRAPRTAGSFFGGFRTTPPVPATSSVLAVIRDRHPSRGFLGKRLVIDHEG
jgi:hypothetical protein